MSRLKIVLVSAIFGSTIIAGTSSNAHDLQGLVTERTSLEPEVRAKFDDVQELRRRLASRAAANPQDSQLEAVVQRGLRWPGGKVRVCFFDGRAEARDRVADVAERWTSSTNLSFDFGSAGNRRTCDPAHPSNIRVSFQGAGYYSYVGTQAQFINVNKQTLNLQGMDRTNFTAHDDGVILHEFGHAIGFEHEHQSPIGGCDAEFNWNYLYTSMGWTPEEVNRNMAQLSTPSGKTGLLTTTFDRESIMLYSLSPAAFKDPSTAKCYIPTPNNDISTLDHKAASIVYPAAGREQTPVGMSVDESNPDAVATAQAIKRIKDFSAGSVKP